MMGNSSSINKINFEDLQHAIKYPNNYLIINTLPIHEQDCLIYGTCDINIEVKLINDFMKTRKDINIIIYGKNTIDSTVLAKYEQLISIGFTNVNVYLGGLFEWLLLQDIYGNSEFKTTSIENDILKFRGSRLFVQNLSLTY